VRALKVYGVSNFRRECPSAPNGSHQTRDIVAARSMAEAARLCDVSASHMRNYGGETGNAEEIAICTAVPGIVFWSPSGEYPRKYQRATR
jgi:hypothetical protein